MLGELVKSIESAFVDLSPRRVVYVVFILGLGIACVLLFDRMTGYSYSKRLETRLSTLERLYSLEQTGIRSSPALAAPFDSLTADLVQLSIRAPAPLTPAREPSKYEFLQKFLAATILPLVFVLYSVFQILRGDRSSAGVFGGAFIGTLILGIPAILVPTVYSLRATVLGLFFIQVVLVFAMTRYYGNKREAAG